MRGGKYISAIIPALNEEGSVALVVSALPAWIDQIVVVDNGSSDDTARVARTAGAQVVQEPQRGYGAACLRGIAAATRSEILLFLDADSSDRADLAEYLIDPIAHDEADFVLGVRDVALSEPGALTWHQQLGNAFACTLIRLIWRHQVRDLGPFRAISHTSLDALKMRDLTFGWTVEMQIKAIQRDLRVKEVAVPYKRRVAGSSKISGSVSGSMKAGAKILFVVARFALRDFVERLVFRPKPL